MPIKVRGLNKEAHRGGCHEKVVEKGRNMEGGRIESEEEDCTRRERRKWSYSCEEIKTEW